MKLTKITCGDSLDIKKIAGWVQEMKAEESIPEKPIETPEENNKPTLEKIWRTQSKMFMDSRASDMQEDFILKALNVGYTKEEIAEGLRQFFRITYGDWKFDQTMDNAAKWAALDKIGLVKN